MPVIGKDGTVAINRECHSRRSMRASSIARPRRRHGLSNALNKLGHVGAVRVRRDDHSRNADDVKYDASGVDTAPLKHVYSLEFIDAPLADLTATTAASTITVKVHRERAAALADPFKVIPAVRPPSAPTGVELHVVG